MDIFTLVWLEHKLPLFQWINIARFFHCMVVHYQILVFIVASLADYFISLSLVLLTNSVNYLSQFMHHPRTPYLDDVIHILKHLKGTINHDIFLSSASSLTLKGYTDFDWAGCPTNHLTLYNRLLHNARFQSYFLKIEKTTNSCLLFYRGWI